MGSEDRELFALIAADPDNAAPYLVLADALQQRGDPRGELIAIQHALESAPPAQTAELRRREGEARIEHEATWVGIDAALRNRLVVRWRYGFIHAARVLLDDDPAATLRGLLAVPEISSTLVELRIGPPSERTDRGFWPDLTPVLEVLHASWPRALRRLYLNEGDLHGLRRAPAVVIDKLGTLNSLVVQARAIAIGSVPAVRRLDLRSPNLALSAVPASETLEELALWSRKPGALGTLTPQRFPLLRRLALVGTTHTDQLATKLVALPIASQLDSLDLTGGTLTAAGLDVLRPLAKRCTLEIKHNLIAKLPRRFARSPQRTGDRSWLDQRELATVPGKIAEIVRTRPKPDLVKYRAIVEAAALGDPAWGYERRWWLAQMFARELKRDLLAELVHEWDRDLAAELAIRGTDSLLKVGGEYDALGDLIAAESWIWRAVHAARWADNAGDERRAIGQIATLRMRRGDPTSAAPILARLAAQFHAAEDPAGEAWAVRQQGSVELTRSNYAVAEGFYLRALELFRALGNTNDEAIVLSELSSVAWSRGDYAGAEKMLRDALKLKDPTALGAGSTYYNLGAILNGANRIDEAIEAGDQALATFRRHRHRGGEGQALSLLGELYQRKNEHAKAKQLLDDALACHRESGALPQTGITLGNLSRVALDLGEYARARAYCEEAVEIHREVGNKYNEGMQLMGIADALIGERAFDEARQALDQALVPLVAIKNGAGSSAVYLRRGIVEQLAGRAEAARRHYDQCCRESREAKDDEMIGWAEIWIAVMHAQARDHARANQVLASARTTIPRDSIQGQGALAMTAAVLARLAGLPMEMPVPLNWDERILATIG